MRNDTTHQIAAAEAAEAISDGLGLMFNDSEMRRAILIIKTAIDKVRTETLAECRAATEQQICDLQDRAAHASELKDDHGRSLKDIQEFERLSLERDDPTMIGAAHAREP